MISKTTSKTTLNTRKNIESDVETDTENDHESDITTSNMITMSITTYGTISQNAQDAVPGVSQETACGGGAAEGSVGGAKR